MKTKSMILALFLTVGMTFGYASGSKTNLPASEALYTSFDLV